MMARQHLSTKVLKAGERYSEPVEDDGIEYEITSGHWPRALRLLEAQKGGAK